MKIYVIIIMILLSGQNLVRAQRLIKGQRGIETGAGLLADRQPDKNNFFTYLLLSINKRNGAYLFYQVEYNRKSYEGENFNIPVETYLGKVGYSFPLLTDPARNIGLNLGIAGTAGYSDINRSNYTLNSGAGIINRSGFVYGASLTLSLEVFITDYCQLLFRGNTDILFGSSVNRLNPTAGLGIRFIL
ncbi:conjugal transfer protein TraO [Pedobacter sp. KLB.chiD]|uniref:conjugal transfer protein TraO n=1 Tax=Pedobacter sp. KLB.chiD TaxID=3387402 RepID=UPI003999A3CE